MRTVLLIFWLCASCAYGGMIGFGRGASRQGTPRTASPVYTSVDLTTAVETDPFNRLTIVSATHAAYTNYYRSIPAHSYIDLGPIPCNVSVRWRYVCSQYDEAEYGVSAAWVCVIGLSDSTNTLPQILTDGNHAIIFRMGCMLKEIMPIEMYDGKWNYVNVVERYLGATETTYYCDLRREDGAFSIMIYSDSDFSSLITQMKLRCYSTGVTLRYLIVASELNNDPNDFNGQSGDIYDVRWSNLR